MADYPNFAGEAQFLDKAPVPTPPANNLAVYSDGGVLKTKNSSGTVTTLGAAVDLASPSAIGSTTPNTGAFTTLSFAPAANATGLSSSSYSLTGSNAQSLISLSGTWNTTGTPSAILLNVTDTASNANSNLINLQTGGTTRFRVDKSSNVFASAFYVNPSFNMQYTGFLGFYSASTEMVAMSTGAGVGLSVRSTMPIGWSTSPSGAGNDCGWFRDAANIVAQRRDLDSQEYRLYGTYTSTTNYQRMTIKSVKQTLSALSGASQTTTGTFIPDGAVVVGVTTRVSTLLTGATGYTIGDGTDADRWGDMTGTAVGTTSDNRDWTAGTIECFTAGGNITLTAKTSNFTAGAIEICVFYLAGEAD